VPFYCVRVVLDCLYEFSMFDVGGTDPIMVFLFLQLVIEDLFKADSLKVEQRDEALVLPAISHDVVGIEAETVHV